jgi:predicted alpha/beta hydrolase family esterase
VRFLILHGLSGSGPGHWQDWLAGTAAPSRATTCASRRCPTPTRRPRPRGWPRSSASARPGGGEVVLAHSLGCLLWLHHRAAGGPPAERALLVAPPGPAAAQAGVPEVAPFFPAPLRGDDRVRWVCSDADPYCPEGAQTLFDGPFDVLPGAGT